MSVSTIPLSSSVDVHVIPILSDNFSYLIHDKDTSTAALVDPAEPQKLLDVATKLQANVTTSLTTHHHWDHAGGNIQLAKLVPQIEIIGSAYESADGVTTRLESGVSHQIKGSSLVVSTLRTPCHTMGHLCFVTDTTRKAVFTGDTLFVAGCGKFFEGAASDMQQSLNSTLASLEDDTFVFCGHEYTVTNLLFAASVEPNNQFVQEKLKWAKKQVSNGVPTVPSTIGDEKQFNPFMRTAVRELGEEVGVSDDNPVEVMKALRERKNAFRP
ncbi:Hydroxyacylglutathione hydrolase, mitochondrial [Gracilariopsis chorda]|uniref:hydroxyacylglutathione hydrolase n=1 Tax=Gracilariopsis chorda TaxID=448386 RepID=A0A2V3J2V9_9FLOR|nr:Hydroxyacylglutathione hydrolase, mitochondrial [Gracilariopsis chorda]|eukprot:PXF48781.1 Hydroxyacylglutathione hydrolase, mitochondrial [Gracilariopsis chorda]